MATRSRIGIENEDGTITSVYCHWDGYIEHNGEILVNSYNEREKVKQLISLGSISSLQRSCECPEGHTFGNSIEGYTVAYHRDRGEDLSIQVHKDAKTYFSGNIEEYGYLFTKDGQWVVKSGFTKNVEPQNVKAILLGQDQLIEG